MSGEPKTLTPQAMTLGEALAAVRAKAKADGSAYMVTEVRFMPFAHYPWWVEMAYGDVKVYADWPPALSFALGVPVVARDEAAELRAAVKEWADAKQAFDDADLAWTSAIDAGADAHGYKAAWERALSRERDAEAALRRLAGRESER